jgi:hypothetical protein
MLDGRFSRVTSYADTRQDGGCMIYGTNKIINRFYVWHYIYGWIEALQPPSSNTDFNLTQPAASQVKS